MSPAQAWRVDLSRAALHSVDRRSSHPDRLHFRAVPWPNVKFDLGVAFATGDWRERGGIVLDVENPSPEAVPVCVRIDDASINEGLSHSRSWSLELPPGRHWLAASLAPPAAGMRGGSPLRGAGSLAMQPSGGHLDRAKIVAFQLFLPRPHAARTLVLHEVRIVPSVSLDGIVDRFGQYAGGDCPGKVHADADLFRQREAETAGLAAHPRPPDRDRWGGDRRGPRLSATGAFRTAFLVGGHELEPPPPGKRPRRGRWWLVDPDGALFYSIGLDVVTPHQSTIVKGRERMFRWLPAPGSALAALSGRPEWVDFAAINLARKYGDDWRPAWTARTFTRLESWGFNTLGNWSEPSLFGKHRVPYTVPIHPPFHEIDTIPVASRHGMPDVYDPRFAKVVDESLRRRTAAWADDPWCLGFFVDNELPWTEYGGTNPHRAYALPLAVLTHAGPARRAFVRQLRTKYAGVGALNIAWQTSVVDWPAMETQPVALPDTLSATCVADLSHFLTAFSERYFSTVAAALRRHAPGRLYLGCRFARALSGPREAVVAAAKYCDVVSFNVYRHEIGESFEAADTLGRPCLIGEFHFGALDRGMFHPGLVGVADQAARGAAYQRYLESVWRRPCFVGAHWFEYGDEALTGRPLDGENYNIGFVSNTDTPYTELVEAARRINRRVYRELAPR